MAPNRNSHDSDFAAGLDHGLDARPAACAAWASLLADAVEDLLSETEETALNGHLAGCAQCAEELADARRGAAWLGLLKGHAPEPSPALLNSILAKTREMAGMEGFGEFEEAQAGLPAGTLVPEKFTLTLGKDTLPTDNGAQPSGRISFWERLGRWFGSGGEFAPALQPRLTMTAAMAFFSICLTLNLLGLPDRTLHAQTFGVQNFGVQIFNVQTLRPMGLQRTVSNKKATLVRTFEGIRVVYRVESRVNEWLTASATPDNAPWPATR